MIGLIFLIYFHQKMPRKIKSRVLEINKFLININISSNNNKCAFVNLLEENKKNKLIIN